MTLVHFGPFEYLAVMAFCVLVTLPLEFVFSARVYRRPRRTLAALAVVVVVFGAWDVWAISRGLWSYSPTGLTGVILPGGLPLEELVFFLVVPLCGLLSYEAVGTVLRWARTPRPRPARDRTAGERTGRSGG